MAESRKNKPKQKPAPVSVRIDLSGEDYDALMDWSEREMRSIRAQAQYVLVQGIQRWRAEQLPPAGSARKG